jgi:hypothetical protein
VRLLRAALALRCAPGALGCGNEDKPARVDARALAAAGFAAVGADSVGMRFTAERRDGVVHLRASRPRRDGLLTVLPMFERVHARIEAFCPPPGILECRPALRASATIQDARAPRHLAEALRKLAARSYGNEPVVRRRGATIRILSPYGELLAGVCTRGRSSSCPLGAALSRRVPYGRRPVVCCYWRSQTLSARFSPRYRRRRARRSKGRGAWPP